MVVFFTALLLVSTIAVAPRILTEGKREKEKEMIWRGKQYTRGVKLYYRKLGRFPNSIDDLTKPKIGNIRFMRQAYKDPMNKEDGSWRLIYVGPSGQLIGSLKPPQAGILMPASGGQPAQAGASTTNPPLGSIPTTGGFGAGGPQTGGTPSGTGTTGGTTPPTIGAGAGAQSTSSGGTGTDSQQVPTGDTPTIVGGNIIGVGSKVNEPSVIIYDTATNYRLFEFIWDPSKDMGMINMPVAPVGNAPGTPGAPGQNPTGFPPNGTNPPPTPPATPPTSNPLQQ
jgi:hypothetical protein